MGIVDNIPILDLCYEEDYKALVDMNIIMTDDNKFVEIQGTGEGYVFSREEFRPWFEDTPVSYAIVTRIFDRHSGRFLVSIAGMTHLATCAAAEFTTRPAYLQALQAQAPKGWEQRNSQAVLETQIVNQTASPPKLVGSYSW